MAHRLPVPRLESRHTASRGRPQRWGLHFPPNLCFPVRRTRFRNLDVKLLTIFPSSVEARAKMKITLGHAELLPDWSSSRVRPLWRTSISATRASTAISTGPSIGAAATRAAQREMTARNFIFEGFLSFEGLNFDRKCLAGFWAWSEGMKASGLRQSLSLTIKRLSVFSEGYSEAIYLI